MGTMNLNVSFDAISGESAVMTDVEGAAGMPKMAASCDPNDFHPDSCDGPGLVIEPDIPDDPDGGH